MAAPMNANAIGSYQRYGSKWLCIGRKSVSDCSQTIIMGCQHLQASSKDSSPIKAREVELFKLVIGLLELQLEYRSSDASDFMIEFLFNTYYFSVVTRYIWHKIIIQTKL